MTKARHLSALSGISVKYQKELEGSSDRKLYEMQTRGSSLFKSSDVEYFEEEGVCDEFECFHRASKLRENGYN